MNPVNAGDAVIRSNYRLRFNPEIYEVLGYIWDQQNASTKIEFFNMEWDDLILCHQGFGRWIRNTFKLWEGQPYLLASMCLPLDNHPDDTSMEIIKKYWLTVRSR